MHTTSTAPRPPAGLVPLFAGILRSESRKLRTVRSTSWTLLAVLAFNIVTAAPVSYTHLTLPTKA